MKKVEKMVLPGNMYNIMHGVNEIAPLLLKILELKPEDTGRFRDIFLNEDGTKIILLTRNGGGNRGDYQDVIDELAKHPNYLDDYDDDFDCTYAYIEFSVPDKYKEEIKKFSTGVKPKTLEEKTNETLAKMDKMSKEEIEQAFPALTDVMKKIEGVVK